jgi:hypothetical protein
MSPDFITEAVRDLTETYGNDHVRTAAEGGRTLVQVDDFELYATCKPTSTPILVVLDPSHPKPVVYVRPGQLLANGRTPKSTSVVMVGGESWLQFSLNVPWEERHGIRRFVAAARQRFAQDE